MITTEETKNDIRLSILHWNSDECGWKKGSNKRFYSEWRINLWNESITKDNHLYSNPYPKETKTWFFAVGIYRPFFAALVNDLLLFIPWKKSPSHSLDPCQRHILIPGCSLQSSWTGSANIQFHTRPISRRKHVLAQCRRRVNKPRCLPCGLGGARKRPSTN